jgi:thiol-disulfide isomerase/thioredoxin
MRVKHIRILVLISVLWIGALLAFIVSTGQPASRSETGGAPSDSGPVSGSTPVSPGYISNVRARSAPKPPSSALNRPGEDFDFSSYLTGGRVTIVYFYAEWCPACRELSPMLAALNHKDPDTQVLFLDIGDWNTPIADRHRVTYVPYLKVYNEQGFLIVEGRAANSWLQETLARHQLR